MSFCQLKLLDRLIVFTVLDSPLIKIFFVVTLEIVKSNFLLIFVFMIFIFVHTFGEHFPILLNFMQMVVLD